LDAAHKKTYLRAPSFIIPLNSPNLESNSSTLHTSNFKFTTTTNTEHQHPNNDEKMRLTALLPAFLATTALSSPVAIANPGEIMPDQSGSVDGEATWYCTWSYEIMYERFVLEGHKWMVSEKELKDLIPGTITGWEYHKLGSGKDGKGWSDFKAKVG
jgi:hypothetical protein